MIEDWLTIREVAIKADVAERTLYRWVDLYKPFLRLRRVGRRTDVAADSLPVITKIRDLFAGGNTAADVATTLSRSSIPIMVDADSSAVVGGEALAMMMATMGNLTHLAERQAEDLSALRELAELEATRRAELEEDNRQAREKWEAERAELTSALQEGRRRVEWLESRVPRWVRRMFGAG